jgi:ADP-heptose:LPS heptosyltransferase
MNILIIRTHRLGDILQLTPMLRGLKKKYCTGSITVLTGSDMADLLSNNPDVDEIIMVPEKKYRYYLKERPEYYAHVYNRMYDLMTELNQRNFQLIINRQYEWGSVVAGSIGKGNVRGGTYSPMKGFHFSDEPSQELYRIVKKDRRLNNRNLVDWACRIAGVEPGAETMRFSPTLMDRWKAQKIFEEETISMDERPVAIQTGAAQSFRQWGVNKYGSLIEWLAGLKNKKIILLGSADEKEQAAELRHYVSSAHGRIIDLTGKTTLKTLGAVLERCECLITGDTGTMHMAAAVGTPVLAIFYGTAYPWETGPYGNGHFILHADMECTPCQNPDRCGFNHRCRTAITPDHVFRAYEIFEQWISGATDSFTWQDNDINLYYTCIRPGKGQFLVPVNNTPLNFTHSHLHTAVPMIVPLDITEVACTLRSKSTAILRNYFIGNSEEYLKGFADFIADWTTLISHMKQSHDLGNLHHEISQMLFPVLIEATRAMENNDLVTISDLIRCHFSPVIEYLEGKGSEGRAREALV